MAFSAQDFDQIKRDMVNLHRELASTKEQAAKAEQLRDKVAELEQALKARYPAPIVQAQEDIAFYEALFDILVRKKVVTQEEIQHYLDQYRQIWTAIANIMIDKGITCPKEINCEMLAYHHFLRAEGMSTGKPKEELFADRQKYVDELMQMQDPLEMLGR